MSQQPSNPLAFAEGLILDDGLLPEIFEVMLKAWARVKVPDKQTLEPRITALWIIQCGRINQEQYSEVGSRFDFLHEVQVNDLVTGKQISRKDIEVRVHGCGSSDFAKRNAPYLVVESKKLAVTSDMSEYIGKDGMLCFIERKYDCFLSHCAMAAYLMDGEIDDFKPALLSKVGKSKKLQTQKTLPSWSILSEFPIHSTTHHLVEGKLIRIQHLFLRANISR